MVDVDAARTRLEGMVAELDRSAEVLENSGGRDTGELSVVDQHPADTATALADADREEASLEVVRDQQAQAREALARIDAGHYGTCVDCGAQLTDERLEARPEAARCVSCQEKAEALQR